MSIPIHPPRYQIIRLTGQGGTAVVYEARDTQMTNRRVALKLFAAHLLKDELRQRAFMNELRAVSALDHPYIVPVYDGGYYEQQPFLVMRWLGGGSLAQKLRKQGAMPWADAVAVFERLATALQYAHKNKLIHRDLKPENILFDEAGQAFLADFGIARRVQSVDQQSSLLPGIIGTPAYMAPEVWAGKKAEMPADIYALACLFAEMLLARPLFDGSSQETIISQHTLKGPHFPNRWAADVPPAFDTVLRKAIARDPQQRYTSVAQFQEAMRKLKPITGVTAGSSPHRPLASLFGGSRFGWLVLLLSLVAGVGLMAVFGTPAAPPTSTPVVLLPTFAPGFKAKVEAAQGQVDFRPSNDQLVEGVTPGRELVFGRYAQLRTQDLRSDAVVQLPNAIRLQLLPQTSILLVGGDSQAAQVELRKGGIVINKPVDSFLVLQIGVNLLPLPVGGAVEFCASLDQANIWRLQCLSGACATLAELPAAVGDVTAYNWRGTPVANASLIAGCGGPLPDLSSTVVATSTTMPITQTAPGMTNIVVTTTLSPTNTPRPTLPPLQPTQPPIIQPTAIN